MTTTIAMTTAGNNSGGGVRTGRIAALSWPATRRDKIIEVVGYEEAPPSPKPLSAWRKACYALAGQRVIVRAVSDRKFEIVEETIRTDEMTGRLYGERVTVEAVEYPEAPSPLGKYRGGFLAAYDEAMEVVEAGVLGTWCDEYVRRKFDALALATRGHLLHVLADRAEAFDAFVAAMRAATGGVPFVACTVDDDPVTLLSLAESLRVGTAAAIEEERDKAMAASTVRGVKGARERLEAVRDSLAKYRHLLGETVAKLEGEIATADEGLAVAEVKLAFPQQAGLE